MHVDCLENPRDGGAWWAAVHGVDRSQTRLSDLAVAMHLDSFGKLNTYSQVQLTLKSFISGL